MKLGSSFLIVCLSCPVSCKSNVLPIKGIMDSTFVDNMAPLTQPANFFHRLKTYFLKFSAQSGCKEKSVCRQQLQSSEMFSSQRWREKIFGHNFQSQFLLLNICQRCIWCVSKGLAASEAQKQIDIYFFYIVNKTT